MSSIVNLNDIKEVCRYCKGTGIVIYPKDDIGTICSCCRGKGYLQLDSRHIVSITKIQTTVSKDSYRLRTIHDRIRTLSLYDGIVLVKNINYVAFANKGLLGTAKQWYEGNGLDGIIVTYKEYLEGKFPLPDEKLLCSNTFADYPFGSSRKCDLICERGQKNECWQEFYKECNSLEEKQKTVAKYVKSLKPRRTF